MQIVVFGANGKVGRLLVKKALDKNVEVVAFVHGKTDLASSKNLKVVVGDIYNTADVEKVIQGTDAVISALGSWGTPGKDVLATGMKNIIPAMQRYKIKRIISLTGTDAMVKGENQTMMSKLSRAGFGVFAKKILLDSENHIQLLLESQLDWTVVRSPVMNEKGNEHDFTLTSVKPKLWATINRDSVARSMIELLSDRNYLKQAPYIQRAKK